MIMLKYLVILYIEHLWPLKFVVMISRYDIYICSKKQISLNIFHLQEMFKKKYEEQKYVWDTKSLTDYFDKSLGYLATTFDQLISSILT